MDESSRPRGVRPGFEAPSRFPVLSHPILFNLSLCALSDRRDLSHRQIRCLDSPPPQLNSSFVHSLFLSRFPRLFTAFYAVAVDLSVCHSFEPSLPPSLSPLPPSRPPSVPFCTSSGSEEWSNSLDFPCSLASLTREKVLRNERVRRLFLAHQPLLALHCPHPSVPLQRLLFSFPLFSSLLFEQTPSILSVITYHPYWLSPAGYAVC